MDIILYSTHCPKCNILKKKLEEKKITYVEETNEEIMIKMGLTSVPVLEVDGEKMNFADAVKWVNK